MLVGVQKFQNLSPARHLPAGNPLELNVLSQTGKPSDGREWNSGIVKIIEIGQSARHFLPFCTRDKSTEGPQRLYGCPVAQAAVRDSPSPLETWEVKRSRFPTKRLSILPSNKNAIPTTIKEKVHHRLIWRTQKAKSVQTVLVHHRLYRSFV